MATNLAEELVETRRRFHKGTYKFTLRAVANKVCVGEARMTMTGADSDNFAEILNLSLWPSGIKVEFFHEPAE